MRFPHLYKERRFPLQAMWYLTNKLPQEHLFEGRFKIIFFLIMNLRRGLFNGDLAA